MGKNIKTKVTVETGKAASGLDKLKGKATQLKGKLKDAGESGSNAFKVKLAAGIAVAGVAMMKLIGIMGKWIGLAEVQARSEALVTQAIKSTGEAAGFTAKELFNVATSLQKITKYGDEEILTGATAQLLTFTAITGDEFLRTQKMALDLSTVLDTDLKSSSIMLGKALNAPALGLSAMSRAGILFTEDQKKMVKEMVAAGDTMGAQRLMLTELEKQYGGQAEAVAKAAGMTKQFSNVMGDFKEIIGAKLIEHIRGTVEGFKDITTAVTGWISLDAAEEIRAEQIELNGLVGALKNNWDNEKMRADLIKEITAKYPEFIALTGDEANSWNGVSDALKAVNKEYDIKIKLMVKEIQSKKIAEEIAEISNKRIKALTRINSLYEEKFGHDEDDLRNDNEKLMRLASTKEALIGITGLNTELVDLKLSILGVAGEIAEKNRELGIIQKETLSVEKEMAELHKENAKFIAIERAKNVAWFKEEQQKKIDIAAEKAEKDKKARTKAIEDEKKAKKDAEKLEEDQLTYYDEMLQKYYDGVDEKRKEDKEKSIEDTKEAADKKKEIEDQAAQDAQDRYEELEVSAQALASALSEGIETGKLKDSLKGILTLLLDFLDKYLMAAIAAAILKGALGDFSGFVAVGAAKVAIGIAKKSIASFRTGTKGEEGYGGWGMADPGELQFFQPNTHIIPKREAKDMLTGFDTSRLESLMEDLIKISKLKKVLATPEGLVEMIDIGKENFF